ncbi:glycosyltransferase family 9 protein [Egbenema bharatensis]|uniref:glycosyltransferase family 9 protein n=1 Tax=Egbenema bharatensis TaxID=3463334 RepID=UPI003A84C3F9
MEHREAIRQILFIELLGGIGDLVIALPAIHALKRSHPQAELTVLTFAPGGELLESDPLIDRVVYAASGQARQAVEETLAQLDRSNILTHTLIVSDTNYDGIADLIQCSSAQQVITNLWRSPPPNERVSDRFLQILRTEAVISESIPPSLNPQITVTPSERAIVRSKLGALYQPVIVLCPDTGMAIKRWSTQHFITVGQGLQQEFSGSIVVIEGTEPEEAEQIAAAIGRSSVVWPRGTLRMLTAMIAEANLVIAPDTGIAHIAAALNIPTLTLFGPTWHERYGQPSPHINLQGDPHCPDRLVHNFTEQRCWYSGECPYDWDTCLEAISPNTVLESAKTLLHSPPYGRFPFAQQLRRSNRPYPSPVRAIRKSPLPLPTPYSSLPTPHSPLLTPHSSLLPPPHPRLLLLRLDNIGDVLMTSPALRTLRENLPEAHITLMASPAGALAAPLLPWIDEVLPWRVLWQDIGQRSFSPEQDWKLIETLKASSFDAAILFTSFSQSPHPAALICALAGIPIRIAESKEVDMGTLTHAVPPASDALHQVDRNLRLLEFLGLTISDRRLTLDIPPDCRKSALQLLQQHAPSRFHPAPFPFLLFNPWTSCPSRNYDPDRFVTAVRQLSNITQYPVVVTGVEKDRARSQSILKKLGDRAIDLMGATTLPELVALVAAARLVLSNNTSTMHIADAVGTPSVILFAGTEMECQWQPRNSPSRLLRRPTLCSPCYALTCPYELQCLDIEPEQVVAAGLELLEMENVQNFSRQMTLDLR